MFARVLFSSPFSSLQLCLNDFGCKCQDAANNTYVCVRTLSPAPATAAVTAGLKLSEKIATAAGGENSLYCHFADQENFIEFYDLKVSAHFKNSISFD